MDRARGEELERHEHNTTNKLDHGKLGLYLKGEWAKERLDLSPQLIILRTKL